MGLSYEEYLEQLNDKTRRFYVRRVEEYGGYNELVDRVTGQTVGTDGGEPEDQTLQRDFAWVADALNSLVRDYTQEIDRLRAELRAAHEGAEVNARVARSQAEKIVRLQAELRELWDAEEHKSSKGGE